MDEAAIAQTRKYGQIISIIAVVSGLLYLVGVLKKNYWALALPVTAATAGALYITLWIGRALMTTPSEPREF
jgi:hypothetical protein